MHTCGSLRMSVTGVVELWILTVPLSPLGSAAVAALAAAPLLAAAPPLPTNCVSGAAPALGPTSASVRPVAAAAVLTPTASMARHLLVIIIMAFLNENSRRRQSRPAALSGTRVAGNLNAKKFHAMNPS